MKTLLLATLMIVGGACYYSDPQVSARYSAGYGYGYDGPALTYVAPGVQVVADYDYPVFYSDGYYWRYDGGLWYRSGYYNRGWNVWHDVPYRVRGISRPEGYVHYRGGSSYQPNQNWGRRNVAPAPSAPVTRSAPTYRAPVTHGGGPVYRSAPSRPIVRDHR